MNRLKEQRLAAGLTQPQVVAELKTVEQRVDVPLVSRYEQGVCLPTPEQLAKLEDTLGADRLELYPAEELRLLGAGQVQGEAGEVLPARRVRQETKYRKCYRVPPAFVATFPGDLLDVCGYPSWNAWHAAALKRLLAEYAARSKGGKAVGHV